MRGRSGICILRRGPRGLSRLSPQFFVIETSSTVKHGPFGLAIIALRSRLEPGELGENVNEICCQLPFAVSVTVFDLTTLLPTNSRIRSSNEVPTRLVRNHNDAA